MHVSLCDHMGQVTRFLFCVLLITIWVYFKKKNIIKYNRLYTIIYRFKKRPSINLSSSSGHKHKMHVNLRGFFSPI